MNVTKMSASMLSLGALDFGIIVDGAIVVTENILRRREAKPDRGIDRGGRQVGDQPGGAADLLCDPDHHHRIFSAVYARSGARPSCSRRWPLRSAMRCSARCSARSRWSPASPIWRSESRVHSPQQAAGMVGARLSAAAGKIARSARASRLWPPAWPWSAWRFSARQSAEIICRIWMKARSGFRSNCRAAFRSMPRARWRASSGAPSGNFRRSPMSLPSLVAKTKR